MLRNVKISTLVMTAVSAALLSACGGGGGSSPSTELVNNATSARSVIDKVAALKATEELTAADAASVAAAINAYNSLSDASKQMVGKETLDKLKAAEQAVKTAAGGNSSADNSVIQTADPAVSEVKSKIAALPDTVKDTDEQALTQTQQAFNALSEQQKTLITTAEKSKLDKLSNQLITDHSPLPALGLDTPLHTGFIKSEKAQQNNPNVQLRKINDENGFTRDQGGLISTLAFNQNDEVKLDGVIISNNTTAGGATQVSFTTPASMIAKAYSEGVTKEDTSAQLGQDKNTTFEVGKASFDDVIVDRYNKLKAAQDNLKAAEYELAKLKKDSAAEELDIKAAEEKVAELQKDIPALKQAYDKVREDRQILSNNIQSIIDSIAYIKKDKNGLIGKKFDGVYVVQFADGTQIVLHDPATAGWTYQTFAHYFDPKNRVLHGYQSLGDETPFTSLPISGTATYNGLTTAYLVQNAGQKQLTADVKAVVDFGKKGVRFETSNAQFHSLSNGVRTSNPADGYNIKGNAVWGIANHFSGKVQTANGMSGDLNGKFYGANAAEIGGTYGLKNADNSEQLIGGYGAKRQ